MNKKLLSIAIAGAMAVPLSAQAVKYKLSGQVNRAIVFMDDGEQSGVRHVDAGTSSSRIRLKGSQDIGNGMKAGFYWENDMRSNKSSGNTPEMNGDGADSAVGIRQSNVWFSGNWGKLTMGHTDGAGNGATENDWVPSGAYHGRTSFTGGMKWRTSGGLNPTGLTEGSTFNEYDAFSRHDVIRYDSPKLGPAKIAASVGNDSVWEVGLTSDANIGGGNLLFSAFYGEDSQKGTDNRWGGSFRYRFSQGTKISGSYAENETVGGLNSDVFTVGIGHTWGNSTVSVHYSQASDVTAGYDDEAWNIGFDHSLPKAKIDLYSAFFHTELNTPVGVKSVEDHNTFLVGARVKFN